MELEAVRERIGRAAARAGRDAAGIRIVAVTKSHPLSAVREAAERGLLDVGENKVQEALAKQEQWTEDRGPGTVEAIRWHLIGHLQRNKAKQAAGRFVLIHSLDSIRLADALEGAAAAQGITQSVLIQVNVAREEQKTGIAPEEVDALVEHVNGLKHLALQGLMTMAPFTEDEQAQRASFRGLRQLLDTSAIAHCPLPIAGRWELSMGMSGDFEIAIEEGATMLRLGTVLFGERLL